MQRIRTFRISAVTAAAALVLLTGGAAFAQHGADDATSSSGSEVHNSTSSHVSVESESSSTVSDDSGNHTELRQKAAEHVAELRQEHKPQSTEKRHKACEAHKQGLQKKFNNIVNNSQKIQDRITGVLDKTVAYKTDNNLSPANFDNLVTTAQTAQQNSAASIAALKDVAPTLDCNNASVASDVATFKTAAKETRDNLKAYRGAVKAVVKSILDTKKTDEGSQQ